MISKFVDPAAESREKTKTQEISWKAINFIRVEKQQGQQNTVKWTGQTNRRFWLFLSSTTIKPVFLFNRDRFSSTHAQVSQIEGALKFSQRKKKQKAVVPFFLFNRIYLSSYCASFFSVLPSKKAKWNRKRKTRFPIAVNWKRAKKGTRIPEAFALAFSLQKVGAIFRRPEQINNSFPPEKGLDHAIRKCFKWFTHLWHHHFTFSVEKRWRKEWETATCQI